MLRTHQEINLKWLRLKSIIKKESMFFTIIILLFCFKSHGGTLE